MTILKTLLRVQMLSSWDELDKSLLIIFEKCILTCGSFKPTKSWSANRKSTKYISANHKKIEFANRISANVYICERSAYLTQCLRPQNCGFAICGTFLWTAHL